MSRSSVTIRIPAKHDLSSHFRWLEREAGTDIAERFLTATDRTFDTLARKPGLGPNIGSYRHGLQNVHKWRVDGFPKILIFYEKRRGGIDIVRVTHAAQDWWSLLDVD